MFYGQNINDGDVDDRPNLGRSQLPMCTFFHRH